MPLNGNYWRTMKSVRYGLLFFSFAILSYLEGERAEKKKKFPNKYGMIIK